ncbi:bifunctional diaminohydroxyphosphoribosylaminopyrimidine deaminase/5-amino-6-(5-phosphoribosylamino)uracil reductase RibD [Rarobacter incanus]|uniref:Riboflavin biosynthesis protein RibD n=1 Tax=Rarobacter incanus TaxID=153494 RepID=A0A542SM02_9MICO|nr:bifunctional diaminohydroxyphosphoribosylaminopyrimidine deaminase/5-amino-6-(5-phosphoribosylamino)uracil reductase RibD [Rarobacter incanus]TQK75659.1 diaminohydroxyphosphoribosylaminopyrimidine deaminase/5-amino-6-(5-phosphoribosylamino)uracil reductase [Rarobacter incanus]
MQAGQGRAEEIPDILNEEEALELAVELAKRGPGGQANPQVGCVILQPSRHDFGGQSAVVGVGWHRGAGTDHAEVAAIKSAQPVSLVGATAVVTLQPCNATGSTGPCAQALVDAGIRRVVYAVSDPAAQAAQSDDYLRKHGVQVVGPLTADDGSVPPRAYELVRRWLLAQQRRRPYVIVKSSASLDGRIAAPDGSSRWITGARARAFAHFVRGNMGAIIVGTETVLIDDPLLSARRPDGSEGPFQPLRVAMGMRDVPAAAKIRTGDHFVHARTRDPRSALAQLWELGVSCVLVEGGGQVISAFLAAGLVDEIHAYIAPMLLGADGVPSVGPTGITTLAQAPRFSVRDVKPLDPDVLLVLDTTTLEK